VAKAATTWVSQILSALAAQRRGSPQSPYLSHAELCPVLKAEHRKQALGVELNRLVKNKLVSCRKVGRVNQYALAPKGAARLEKQSSQRPWNVGTIVSSLNASYELTELLRPVHREPSARVVVYKAIVKSIAGRPHDPKLRVRDVVVIKTVPNELLADLPLADANARDRYFSELTQLFDLEASKIETIRHLSCVAKTRDWGKEKVEIGSRRALLVPFVVQEFIGGPDLGTSLQGEAPEFVGMSDVGEWFRLGERLADGLKQVQSAGSFFRYIAPSTIFHRGGDPVFVDLMEALFHVPAWPVEWESRGLPGTDASTISATQPTGAQSFIAPEQRGGLRLEPSRAADVYALGAVLYYMATGRAPRFDASGQEGLKRSVMREMRGTISDDNYGIADIVSRSLRIDVRERISEAHELLSDFRTFDGRRRAPLNTFDFARRFMDGIALAENGGAFASLAAVELETFERVLSELNSGSVTIRGGHNALVVKLCRYLSTLEKGDEYWAVTVPDFWSPQNLGMQGRYLSMNAEIIRRGASVSRVFLLTDDDRRKDEVVAVVRAQCALEQDLERLGSRIKGKLHLRYQSVPGDAERQQVIAEGHQCGLWVKGDSLVRVRPIYGAKRLIRRVNISSVAPADSPLEKKRWRDFFALSKPLRGWETEVDE
jgi:serine/threonine protein kinase